MARASSWTNVEYVGEMAHQDVPIPMLATSTLRLLAMMGAATIVAVQGQDAVLRECIGTGN